MAYFKFILIECVCVCVFVAYVSVYVAYVFLCTCYMWLFYIKIYVDNPKKYMHPIEKSKDYKLVLIS